MKGNILFEATAGGIVARKTVNEVVWKSDGRHTKVSLTEKGIKKERTYCQEMFEDIINDVIRPLMEIRQDERTNVYDGKELMIDFVENNDSRYTWRNVGSSGCVRSPPSFKPTEKEQILYTKIVKKLEELGNDIFENLYDRYDR